MTETAGTYHTDNQLPMTYSLESPHTLIALADDLSKFITEQHLSVKIQGKNFVTVEGWQFAGVSLGLVPVIQSIQNLSTVDEYKYQCSVNLIQVKSGEVVGTGYALCSNKEPNKRSFQEYAILSMSQTRAISRAYRNVLAWLMKASGFEPTPAEEIVDEFERPEPRSEPPRQQQPPGGVSNDRIAQVIEALNGKLVVAIRAGFGSEAIHPGKKSGLIRFYESHHQSKFVQHIKTFGDLKTVGDVLILMNQIPDERVHPMHARYWTESELLELEARVKEVAGDNQVSSEP